MIIIWLFGDPIFAKNYQMYSHAWLDNDEEQTHSEVEL